MKSQQIKEPAVDKDSALKRYLDEIKDTKTSEFCTVMY